LQDGIILRDGLAGRGGQEGGLGEVTIPGEDGLAVVQNQGDIPVFEGSKF
jgi:hypothetical protein